MYVTPPLLEELRVEVAAYITPRKPIDHAYRLVLSRRASRPVELQILFPDNADHDYINSRNFSPVHKILFGMGRPLTVSMLSTLMEIDPAVDVNARDAMGMTPLSWAADMNDASAIEHLLKAGADPNISDNRSMTPLMRTADDLCMTLLLDAGARIDDADLTNQTPLFFAAKSPPCVKCLLDRGASLNIVENTSGFTAVHASVHDNRDGAVGLLLDCYADYMIPAKDGSTLVHTALRVARAPTLQVLAAAKLQLLTPDTKDNEGVAISELAKRRATEAPELLEFILPLIDSLGSMEGETGWTGMDDLTTAAELRWWDRKEIATTII